MPELNTDRLSCVLVKLAVTEINLSAMDWCRMTRELLVTLASVGCAQFMEPLQPVFMKYFAGREHALSHERSVAFCSI